MLVINRRNNKYLQIKKCLKIQQDSTVLIFFFYNFYIFHLIKNMRLEEYYHTIKFFCYILDNKIFQILLLFLMANDKYKRLKSCPIILPRLLQKWNPLYQLTYNLIFDVISINPSIRYCTNKTASWRCMYKLGVLIIISIVVKIIKISLKY